MTDQRTPQFLAWLADRFINVYSESPNVDFVMRLRREVERARTLYQNLMQNDHTYMLVDTGTKHIDGRHGYELRPRGGGLTLGRTMFITDQQAADLSRQLDAPIDYFND